MSPAQAAAIARRVSTRGVAVAALFLFASGFSALVYQILWLRLLGLVFGVTVHAASTVLATFMAGLALGSLVAGRIADRTSRPLRWFGAAELLVGLTALSTPLLLSVLDVVYRSIYAAVSDDLRILTAVRFVCSFAALLVPTTLMGATVPFVLRAVVNTAGELGSRAATLYAANTAGAVAGAVTTGYYLIGMVGIEASFRLAAAVNVVVGIIAIASGGFPRGQRAIPTAAGGGALSVAHRELPPRSRAMVLGVFGISGFVALALEVIWFRALVMYVAATAYAFTTILAVVLGGIAAGSAMATRALRRERDWMMRLAVLQIAIALAATASMAAQGWTYSAGWRTGAALQASALAILPTTILMGAAFPIGLHCWTAARADALQRAGDRIGRFYLVNLTGAIAGAVVTGFVLIPWIGTRRSLIAVASLSLLAGLGLLSEAGTARRRFSGMTAAASLVGFAAISLLIPDPLQTVLARRYGGERVLWREEGAQASVSVHAGEHRAMYLDGLHQANDSPAMLATHRQIGALAMGLRPRARDALVIGLGGGATAGAAARFADSSVDVVELSPSVIRAADWFRHAHGDVVRRPNVRVHVDDGRNYLLMTASRYDVITADIIQPFHAGAGNLYSVEYFRLAARALRDDGLILQWIGNRAESQYKLIARTFLSAFPHTTVWANGTLLAGTKQPLALSRSLYQQRLAGDTTFSAALGTIGVQDFDGLLRLYTAGAAELAAFIGPGEVLTDDRPLVEYFLSLPEDERDMPLGDLRGDVGRHIVP